MSKLQVRARLQRNSLLGVDAMMGSARWWVLCCVWLALALPVRAQTVEYIHTDALGTPVAITDSARNLVERSEYEPYGQVLNRAVKDGPGFTGHVSDAETGLSYMQQRYYDPQVGRFLSVDPISVQSSGSNFGRYWYANNNPYRFSDPDGRQTVGEFIDSNAEAAASSGDDAATYGWAFAGTAWSFFGAENVSQLADKGSGAGTAATAMAVLEVATLGRASTAEKTAQAGLGVVYRRVNPKTLQQYIGMAKNWARYIARQQEHNRALKVVHEFEILGRAEGKAATRYLEETEIRAHGGIQREGGPLANKIHAMSRGAYEVSGRLDSKKLARDLGK